MLEHKKLSSEDYEAAFLFSHFVNSCHTDTSHGECSSNGSEEDFWAYQENLGGVMKSAYCRNMVQASRAYPMTQDVSNPSGHGIWDQEEHFHTSPSPNMKKIKDFARDKKNKHCSKINLNSEGESREGSVSESLGAVSSVLEHHAMQCSIVPEQLLDTLGSANCPGFICAYCAAKFPERRFLIKHLLGDHGVIRKMDQKPQFSGKRIALPKHPMHSRI